MVIIGRYNEPLSTLIHRFKFQKQFWLDRTLARLLYLAVRNARRTHGLMIPDAIIPVPLHHFRQWQRGYNQADLLARQLAKWLRIPYAKDVLRRTKRTPTQRGLSAKDRRQNLKNAFQLTPTGKQRRYRCVVWWTMSLPPVPPSTKSPSNYAKCTWNTFKYGAWHEPKNTGKKNRIYYSKR